ncbi:exopolysaccharide biosynthesis polyprenyl glycosylphosphotransferase [Kineosphaera limosa]|uniref:Putative glycosyltransferase n=1 Tax=Kineosphaera limosa NBRC 100340 TaxID=1184609 RepID=K6VCT1_9MICO|nr:sugar transferase [Kineosphaera limosa]NYE02176.1 exopolysaccharide biosynthesis polyprenyl glycosylphosphotransferase [Kineosphaera limosa]GAB94028.1 putative glycosyltransferase [Kineosphaera limosa NBRC 100340]
MAITTETEQCRSRLDSQAPKLHRARVVDDPAPNATGSRRARGWHVSYLQRVVPLDIIVAQLATIGGALTRTGEGEAVAYLAFAPVVVVAWLLLLTGSDAYGRRRVTIGSEQLRAVGRAAVLGVAVVAVLAYGTHFAVARSFLLVTVAVLVVGSVSARLGARAWLRRRRSQGRLAQRAVVVGRADSVAELIASLRDDAYQGLLPVAACASPVEGSDGPITGSMIGDSIDDVAVIGRPDNVLEAVTQCHAEVVVVAAHPDLSGPVLRRLTWALEERGIELLVSPGILDVAGPRLSIRPSTQLSLLHVERPARPRFHDLAKAAIDRVAAALLLLLIAPVLIAVTIAIRLDDGGPVLFRQRRVGVHGEHFSMYKFRTMVPDAEARLEALLQAQQFEGVLFKMDRDPRITRVGGFLRRYSIDELPQLLNVLFGQMSLVGPRPPLPREVDQYEPDALRRLRVRPGMTGLWQVSGRSDLTWEQSLRLDLHYVDNWSPLGDLHILCRTVSAVFRGSGAY